MAYGCCTDARPLPRLAHHVVEDLVRVGAGVRVRVRVRVRVGARVKGER